MEIPRYVRALILIFSFFSIFWLPWPFSIFAMFIAGLILPPVAFLLGFLADLLYYPGHGLPWGLITGASMAILSYAVRYIVKTRII